MEDQHTNGNVCVVHHHTTSYSFPTQTIVTNRYVLYTSHHFSTSFTSIIIYKYGYADAIVRRQIRHKDTHEFSDSIPSYCFRLTATKDNRYSWTVFLRESRPGPANIFAIRIECTAEILRQLVNNTMFIDVICMDDDAHWLQCSLPTDCSCCDHVTPLFQYNTFLLI